MSEHWACPRCNNVRDGTTVYQCRDCGEVFCQQCAEESWRNLFPMKACPNCNSSYVRKLGFIKRERIR